MAAIKPLIIPHLWFASEAREAAEFYCSIFPDSGIIDVTVIPDTPSGDCEQVFFQLCGQEFRAISAGPLFHFNEAISMMVLCETQDDIDHYWQCLSAVPEAEQCGWLKDRFGLSWQIIPRQMEDMMRSTDPELIRRLTRAFLGMKKLDLAVMQQACDG